MTTTPFLNQAPTLAAPRMRERRKTTEHDIVMSVIKTMMWFGLITYGTLSGCLLIIVVHGIRSGQWELAIVTALISSVSAGASASAGFMAGVLSQTFKSPLPVTTEPNNPLKTVDVTQEASASDASQGDAQSSTEDAQTPATNGTADNSTTTFNG